MSDHLSKQQLERFRRRTMPSAELVAAFDHVSICVTCRDQVRTADQLQNAYIALGPHLYSAASEGPAHLIPEQMAAYVDDEMSEVDREIAEGHLELCAQCKTEMRELREFEAALTSFPVKENASMTPPPFWRRFAVFWRLPAHWIPLQVAAAMALLLSFWIATVSLRKQVADLRARVSQLQQMNDALQDQVSSISDLQTQLAQLQQSQAQIMNSSSGIVVALFDGGGLVTLDKQGSLTGPKSIPPRYEELAKTALTTQRVKPPPTIAELIGKTEILMGSADEHNPFRLLTPVGTFIQTNHPTFRWSSLSGATSYVVTVFDSHLKQVATSQQLPGTEWTMPDSLEGGGLYSWEVTAIKEGKEITSPRPPAPQVRFKVLEQAKLDELDRAKHTYTNSHLVLGVLYAQAGLLDDAERELKALASANPHSHVAQKLLRSAKALRGQ